MKSIDSGIQYKANFCMDNKNILLYFQRGKQLLQHVMQFDHQAPKLMAALITDVGDFFWHTVARITEFNKTFMLWIPKPRWLPSHWLSVHSHVWTLVKAHVGITAKPFHLLPHWVCSTGLEVRRAGLWQDLFHLRCWRHFRDVVAILFTWTNKLVTTGCFFSLGLSKIMLEYPDWASPKS